MSENITKLGGGLSAILSQSETPSQAPEIGRRLAHLRTRSRFSQEELAVLLQISLQDYESYEAGLLECPLSVAYRASRLFGVYLEWIAGGELRSSDTVCDRWDAT